MARTLYPSHGGTQFYSVAEWSLADDDAQNQSKPVAGDTIILTANSAHVLCNEAWAAASLSHPGAGTSQWYFGAQIAVVSGIITLDNITATVDGATISAVGFDLGTNGQLTSGDDWALTSAFELDGGTIVGTGDVMTLDGTLFYSSGNLTDLSIIHDGTNNADWHTADFANKMLFSYTVPAGAVITLNGTSLHTKALAGSGTINRSAAQNLRLWYVNDNFWTFTGVCNVPVDIYCEGDRSTGGAIVLVNADLSYFCQLSSLLTMDGQLNVGTGELYFYSFDAGSVARIGMNGNSLICGDVIVGSKTTTNKSGAMILGATATLASIAAGNAANLANGLTIGACVVTASGKVTLDYIATTISTGSITATDLDIGTSGALVASGDFTTDADVLIDGGTFNLGSGTWAQTNGNAFTHTSGTFTCTSDYSGIINAAGNSLTSITATNWVTVLSGVDGGGNTKLAFATLSQLDNKVYPYIG